MSLLKHAYAILSELYQCDLFIMQLQRLSKSSTNPHFVPGKSEIGFCGTDWSDSLLKFPPSHRKAIRSCQIYRGHLSKRQASPSSPSPSPSLLFLTISIILIIIITRPKPAYGRQGLAGSWGQDTGYLLGCSQRLTTRSGAQLGYKLTWNHEKQTWNL